MKGTIEVAHGKVGMINFMWKEYRFLATCPKNIDFSLLAHTVSQKTLMDWVMQIPVEIQKPIKKQYQKIT